MQGTDSCQVKQSNSKSACQSAMMRLPLHRCKVHIHVKFTDSTSTPQDARAQPCQSHALNIGFSGCKGQNHVKCNNSNLNSNKCMEATWESDPTGILYGSCTAVTPEPPCDHDRHILWKLGGSHLYLHETCVVEARD